MERLLGVGVIPEGYLVDAKAIDQEAVLRMKGGCGRGIIHRCQASPPILAVSLVQEDMSLAYGAK